MISNLAAGALPAIAILLLLISIHEWGHYFIARRFGITIKEYAIGLGPALWHRTSTRTQTLYTVRAIPLGGFVQIADSGPHSMRESAPWVRFLVYAAGPAVNVIFAFALLFGLFVSHSAPFIAPIVNTLTPDGAALAAGLQPGDRLTAVNGVAVYQFSDVHALATLSPAHHPDTIAFIRDGQVHSVVVVKKGGLFGIQSPDMRYASGPLEAAEFAATAIASATNLTVNLPTLLWQLKEPPGDVLQGPVAIADMTGDIVKQSGAFAPLAMLTALLSIAIGLTNLIPIPILDGGRMLIIVIEALARRQLDRRIENLLVASSAAFMLVVLLLVTYKDVSVYFQ